MKNKIFSLFFILGMVLPFAVKAADQSSQNPVNQETLMVCSNLDMYADFAVDGRDSALPKEVAFNMVQASMNRHLKIPANLLSEYIAVVGKIYELIYADQTIQRGATQATIVDACSHYKGQNADTRYIANYLERNPRSAWDPLKRVPLCENIGQSASNVAVARDKGMSKESASALVKTGLQNDQLTLRVMPAIINEVFENPDVDTTYIYVYNLRKCVAIESNQKYTELTELKPRMRNCEKLEKEEDRLQCDRKIFGL
ncbi:hypothetical protein [Undibacterium sp. KW1]|uniref:hypothetical protein n=1 Tax=Undibacterium sp. KW1 TaxID=2058624 RepID=UPI001389572B|nr:hypothetical protein [Undibacterium sp. KW1]